MPSFSKPIAHIYLALGLALLANLVNADSPTANPPKLLVLGSGGPEIDDGRASSGYAIWHQGKPKVIVDLGTGSLHTYEQAGGQIESLEAIAFTHFHVDHSADLPALVKASFFTNRDKDLPVFGPTGNQRMPSTTSYLQALLAENGAYEYLQSYLTEDEAFEVKGHQVDHRLQQPQTLFNENGITLAAIGVHHGPIPALAWRVSIGNYRIVFSGDMNGDYDSLPLLAENADILVAHNAVPETATGVARRLHMPPSVIGKIAAKAKVKKLVLSHRMNRTLGKEAQTLAVIRQHYQGPVEFAEDGSWY